MVYTETRNYVYNSITETFNYGIVPSITDKLTFINVVTNIVLNNNGYVPFLKPIAFNYALVQVFTDIDCYRFVNNENNFDIDSFVEFDTISNISNDLKLLLPDELIDELIDSVDNNIAYKTGINKDSISVAVCNLLKNLNKLVLSFNASADSDKLIEFIDKVNNTDLSAESVVKEYFKSDSFRDNVASVIGEKNEEIVRLKDRITELTSNRNE